MRSGMVLAGIAVAFVAVGCTSVQKGTAAGAAVGTGVGAGVGRAASTIGTGPGAILGLGMGAAGGAIAADYYYEDQDSSEIEAAAAEIQRLEREAAEREAKLAGMQTALAKEQAQQKALLQAYEKARAQDGSGADAGASSGADVGPTVHVATISSNVLFDSGKAAIRKAGRDALRKAAREIRSKSSDVHIEVKGHTDNVPIKYSGFKSNYELSCARAQAVVEYLVSSCGFDRNQFTVTGCGATEPVASNKTASGRQRNRRAEIIARARVSRVADAGDSQ